MKQHTGTALAFAAATTAERYTHDVSVFCQTRTYVGNTVVCRFGSGRELEWKLQDVLRRASRVLPDGGAVATDDTVRIS